MYFSVCSFVCPHFMKNLERLFPIKKLNFKLHLSPLTVLKLKSSVFLYFNQQTVFYKCQSQKILFWPQAFLCMIFGQHFSRMKFWFFERYEKTDEIENFGAGLCRGWHCVSYRKSEVSSFQTVARDRFEEFLKIVENF